MKAMLLQRVWGPSETAIPLARSVVADPVPREGEILIAVTVCGVCHTELDEIEGRTPPRQFPVIPGHQVVGKVIGRGSGVRLFQVGDRVGVGWIFSACGRCDHCRRGDENLCAEFRGTGRDANGGYAGLMTVREEFAFPVPAAFSDAQAAPLFCAGAIGYRSLRLAELQDGQTLGLTGFGASAHLVLQMCRKRMPSSAVLVFSRSPAERSFAMELGAAWAGDIGEDPPATPDAIIDTTPAWRPVVESLRVLASGGRLVINAIRKEEGDRDYLARLDYARHLWMEKRVVSVANVTRRDIREFLDLAAQIPLAPEVREYPLEDANGALMELKKGSIRGAKVLRVS